MSRSPFRHPAADPNLDSMAQVAAQVLRDPLLKRRLGDRLYELLQHDLRIQQDRVGRYGRRSG